MTLYTIRQRGANGYVYLASVIVSAFDIHATGTDPEFCMRFETREHADAVLKVVLLSSRAREPWHVHPIEVLVQKKEEHNENHS
jgi:hypothetical protein